MARAECQGLGGDLVVIEDEAERDWLDTAVAARSTKVSRFWIGLSDAAVEGDYVWVDGSALSYAPWAVMQPGGGALENCIAQHGADERGWHDWPCGSRQGFVCELP